MCRGMKLEDASFGEHDLASHLPLVSPSKVCCLFDFVQFGARMQIA